jgi:hypothetical protein
MTTSVSDLRPRHVTIIAVLWIAWGAVNFLNNMLSVVQGEQAIAQMGALGASRDAVSDFRSVQLVALFIALVSGAGALSAFFLLRLRAWARTWLELANWATVAIVAMIALKALAVGPMALVYLIGAVPFVYVAMRLRGQDTREPILRAHMRERQGLPDSFG